MKIDGAGLQKDTCDRISDLKPPGIKEELQEGENGHVEVKIVTRVTLSGVQKLTTDETHQEKTVDGQCHHLSERTGTATGQARLILLSCRFRLN